jgi:hypothetical protein
MKTFSKIGVLFPLLAAACGGATHADFRAAPEEMECSLSIETRSSALEVQAKVNAVLEGRLNPCGDSVADLRSMNPSLARIDPDPDLQWLRLAFRVANADHKPFNVP